MADNFLEKQMEDYRSGRLAMAIRRPAVGATSVFIVGDDREAIERCVRKCRALGWRTAFADRDQQRGRDLAQCTGSQHHPIDASDPASIARSVETIRSRWKSLDLVIIAGSNRESDIVRLINDMQIFYLFA